MPYDEMYRDTLADLSGTNEFRPGFSVYWQAGSVDYEAVKESREPLKPRIVENDPETVWRDPTGTGGASPDGSRYYALPAPDNQDVAFRTLVPRMEVSGPLTEETRGAYPLVQGTFDPTVLADVAGRGGLGDVPLQTYAPPLVIAADDSSRFALKDLPLGPTANIGGYVSQPAALLTTLSGIQGLLDPRYFDGADGSAPISVIRVRVAGVAGPDEASLERIRRVAAAISEGTGLDVDITAGSSPQTRTVLLPAGRFGQPPLTVSEGWTRKGVAVVILDAVDRKSATLFSLILLLTGIFLTTATWTAVRARRAEFGVLRAFGWGSGHLAAAVVLQTVAVGLLAGTLGAAVAVILIRAMALQLPEYRALWVIPVAVALTLLASIAPALLAARTTPIDAMVRDASSPSRASRIGSLSSLAFHNLRSRAGRAVGAGTGLFFAVAASVIVLSASDAYRRQVTDSALADFVRTSTRGVDYLAVVLVFLLAAIAIADVLALNVQERAAEFGTLKASGWSTRHILTLVLRESALLGLLASAAGALAGIGVGFLTGARMSTLLLGAAGAMGVGTALAMLAGLGPAWRGSKRSIARVLSEE